MKQVKFAMAAAAAMLLGGCTTVEMSSPGSLKGVDVKGAAGKADRVIQVANEGYFLFQTWPLASGYMAWDAKRQGLEEGFELFSDQLSGDKLFTALSHYADSRNCDLVDIVIIDRNQCQLGLFSIMDWVNSVVAYRSMSYSAVLRPRN